MAVEPVRPLTRLVRDPEGRWTTQSVTGAAPAGASPPIRLADGPLGTGPMVRRLAVNGDGTDRYLVVLGDSGQPTDRLIEELGRVVGDGEVLIDGQEIPSGEMVERLGLRDGQSVGPISEAFAPPTEGWMLRVVGGPCAGRLIPVGSRPMSIGRGDGNVVQLPDPSMSRSHLVVHAEADGVAVYDLGSENGTRVEGVDTDRVVLGVGELFRIGDTLVQVGAAEDVETVSLEQRHGHEGLHRRFRTGIAVPPTRIAYPRRQEPGDPQPLNALMAVLPALGIGMMALVFGRPEMLIFAAMSPLLAVARTVTSRRNHRKKLLQAEIDHRKAVGRYRQDLEDMRAAERRHRRRLAPDPAVVVESALRPTTELWSRRATDNDALTVRVGSAFADSAITVEGRASDEQVVGIPPPQPWLPVTIPLDTVGGLALVGELDRLRPLARSLVLQAAVLHAPSELRIVFLGGPETEEEWRWLRWLPHLRHGPLESSLAIGGDAGARSARVEELRRILSDRREEADGRPIVFAPRILVVYDDVSARLGEGVAEILRQGGQFGIHALALDALQVPEGCNASVVLGDRVDAARVEQQGEPPVHGVITDGVDTDTCERVARRLAPIQVVGEGQDQGLPTSCRLLSTLGIEPDAAHVQARWAASSPSPRAVIGVGHERPVRLDLTRDGPHALVAGTTGAGKSEFIKTLIASLALENHPDHLSVLLIDFKGGGDYQLLRQLPHAVALTTNLDDPSAFERTLALLDAEMARRIDLLQEAGTNSIDGYMARVGGPAEPMPRLVVVVDEFAELKDKAPAQLDRLVSVARTGRSVGVHLVLATQRPSGVVTSQIDANVGLRVCFRVTDEAESKEIIDSPLAGRIAERHRGRCLFRSAATPLTEAQTARIAGARPGAVSAAPIRVIELDWERLGRPLPRGSQAGEVPDPDTDLWDVVNAVRTAAAATGWTRSAIPWPPELPEHTTLGQLPGVSRSTGGDGARSPGGELIPVGLVDIPQAQQQEPLSIRMGGGHVVVAGSGRTGRSTALRSFLAGVVQRYGPADARIAALDFGGGALLPVEQLPHCMGLAMEDLDRCEGIVGGLERELARRRELFATYGWPDLPAQRASAQPPADTAGPQDGSLASGDGSGARSDGPLPWLVLVIDGWDNLAEEGLRQGLPARIAQLLARGAPQGLQVVMAGDRGTTHSQIARHLTHRYGLRFNRLVDAELQGIMARELPKHQPPGRAVEIQTKRLVQFAELDDPDDVGQGVAFQRLLTRTARHTSADVHPDVGMLTTASLAEAAHLRSLLSDGPPDGMAFPLLLGLGDDPRAARWLDADQVDGLWFVVGPPGTGRSNTLRVMAASAGPDVDIVVLAPDHSPMVNLPRARRVDVDVDADQLQPAPERRLLVLVDDLDQLQDSRSLQQALGSPVGRRAVVVAAELDWIKLRFSGLAAAVRRPRRGMILSPGSTANGVEMFSRSLDPSLIKSPRPGRAVVNLDDEPEVVQVPRCSEEHLDVGGEEPGRMDR